MERLNVEYRDKYLRAVAELDNHRKRSQRDLELTRQAAREELMTDFLQVLDNFERAIAVAEQDTRRDGFHRGVDMIHRQMKEVLVRHGLEEFSCLGEEFDPRMAEAVDFVHSEEHGENTVVEEQCKGYRCEGRVIRPARVVVAKRAPGNGESGDGDAAFEQAAGA